MKPTVDRPHFRLAREDLCRRYTLNRRARGARILVVVEYRRDVTDPVGGTRGVALLAPRQCSLQIGWQCRASRGAVPMPVDAADWRASTDAGVSGVVDESAWAWHREGFR